MDKRTDMELLQVLKQKDCELTEFGWNVNANLKNGF